VHVWVAARALLEEPHFTGLRVGPLLEVAVILTVDHYQPPFRALTVAVPYRLVVDLEVGLFPSLRAVPSTHSELVVNADRVSDLIV